ncbi:MAG TPA: NAD(P)/FAD-dependent oxidoreductase [Polyangiaceae bacterium]|nr:NAD(P)/FAD-dependent oxidoreductase [Polyangiaceae bacterium]
MHDVIIVGGSYAGLAAALQLGRARRSVLVLDGGERRNRFVSASHGFLGHDGASPNEIAAKGKAEVLAYPTVQWLDALVTKLHATSRGFVVQSAAGQHEAKRLIVATGVIDALPSIEGLAERWGKSVFHCPYCDGYELARGRLGVLATSPHSIRYAQVVAEWSAPGQTTLFLDEGVDPSPEQVSELSASGIAIERAKVVAAEGTEPGIALRLEDGRTSPLAGLFVMTQTRLPGGFAEQLGCELEQGPTGPFFKTDESKETTVPGVFACGDVALAKSTVSFAIADGVRAGIGAHQSLVFRPDGAR